MEVRPNQEPKLNIIDAFGEEIKQEDESKPDKEVELKDTLISSLKEILIAVIIIMIIIGSLWAYTGHWPPVAVVESNSMMHSEDSTIGTMDTGDIVMIKNVKSQHKIKTYVDGLKSNYQTYGSYGDVIAFKKNGGSGTPIIHRAVLWVEINLTLFNASDENTFASVSFDVPNYNKYNVTDSFSIPNYGHNKKNLTVNIKKILDIFFNLDSKGKRIGIRKMPHNGFLTKGDNNDGIDQASSITDSKGRPIEPVKPEWVVGKSEGELSWFGLIKLYINGETSQAGKKPPPTSINMLITSIILIIIIMVILHILFWRMERENRRKREAEEERKLLPFKKRIEKRLSVSQSVKSVRGPGPKLEDVSKGEMLKYLDDSLNVGVNEELVAKTNILQKSESSQEQVRLGVSDLAPPAQPVLKAEASKTQTTLGQKSTPPMAQRVYAPQTSDIQPPFAFPKSRYRQAIDQPEVAGEAPVPISVSDDTILTYLDNALEEKE